MRDDAQVSTVAKLQAFCSCCPATSLTCWLIKLKSAEHHCDRQLQSYKYERFIYSQDQAGLLPVTGRSIIHSKHSSGTPNMLGRQAVKIAPNWQSLGSKGGVVHGSACTA